MDFVRRALWRLLLSHYNGYRSHKFEKCNEGSSRKIGYINASSHAFRFIFSTLHLHCNFFQKKQQYEALCLACSRVSKNWTMPERCSFGLSKHSRVSDGEQGRDARASQWSSLSSTDTLCPVDRMKIWIEYTWKPPNSCNWEYLPRGRGLELGKRVYKHLFPCSATLFSTLNRNICSSKIWTSMPSCFWRSLILKIRQIPPMFVTYCAVPKKHRIVQPYAIFPGARRRLARKDKS